MAQGPEHNPTNPDVLRGVQITSIALSHAINNPLAIAVGMTELMQQDPTLTVAQREFLYDINGALNRIGSVVNDLSRVRQVITQQTPQGEALDIQKSMAEPMPGHTEPS